MKTETIINIFLFSLISIFALHEAKGAEKPISVFVSIPPQAYLVERIGGDRVSVEVLVLPGESPATYTPSPAQISKLTKSVIYFRIGVPFENSLVPKINAMSKQLRIVDTRRGIKLRKIEGRHEHHGKNSEEKASSGNDPHIWLDPLLMKVQAYTIYEGLAGIDHGGETTYHANYLALARDLEDLDRRIRQALEPVMGGTLFVFHPAFGYFADAYNLKQIAVEMEGKAPKGKELSLFIKKAKKEKVHVLFVQPQFDKNAALKIASAINGVVVSIDPLEKDYITNLNLLVNEI